MLLTDALFQGGLAYSAYQTLGRWYRFKASTERRFDDRELLAQARSLGPPLACRGRCAAAAWGARRPAAALPSLRAHPRSSPSKKTHPPL